MMSLKRTAGVWLLHLNCSNDNHRTNLPAQGICPNSGHCWADCSALPKSRQVSLPSSSCRGKSLRSPGSGSWSLTRPGTSVPKQSQRPQKPRVTSQAVSLRHFNWYIAHLDDSSCANLSFSAFWWYGWQTVDLCSSIQGHSRGLFSSSVKSDLTFAKLLGLLLRKAGPRYCSDTDAMPTGFTLKVLGF